MSKEEIFEATKSIFEKWDKEEVVEYCSAVLSELVSSGVSVSACDITPPYIEYVDYNGLLQREYTMRDKLSIQEQLTLNFARHDEEVKGKLMKELIKNIPSPKKITEVSAHD